MWPPAVTYKELVRYSTFQAEINSLFENFQNEFFQMSFDMIYSVSKSASFDSNQFDDINLKTNFNILERKFHLYFELCNTFMFRQMISKQYQ